MIRNIVLKFGQPDRQERLEIPCDRITVFVGPNNSGKSLVLRELESSISSDSSVASFKIIERSDVEIPEPAEFAADIERLLGEKSEKIKQRGTFQIASKERHSHLGVSWDYFLEMATERKESHLSNYRRHIAPHLALLLDGRTRFSLLEPKPMEDMTAPPTNMLMKILLDRHLNERISNLTYDAFGLHLLIDYSFATQLQIALSESRPNERFTCHHLIDKEAAEYLRQLPRINDFGDRVKMYTAIICAIYSGAYKVLFIDEPEAFLHPPLARKLGLELAKFARERKGGLFASTHSAEFVQGCIQSGEPVNIIRMEYRSGTSKIRVVSADKLREMLRDPIMRNTNVLSSLFYDSVVVCEAEGDRVLYSEIAERLMAKEGRRSYILFLNARNKQSEPQIIGPLRDFGIAVAGIYDLDVLGDEAEPWKKYLDAAKVPQRLRNGVTTDRAAINKALEEKAALIGKKKKDFIKEARGICGLNNEDRKAAKALLDRLETYGMFIVPNGALESWLPELEAKGDKDDWVDNVLRKLGTDPNEPGYLHPGVGGVWAFVKRTIAWLGDREREGLE